MKEPFYSYTRRPDKVVNGVFFKSEPWMNKYGIALWDYTKGISLTGQSSPLPARNSEDFSELFGSKTLGELIQEAS